jgi:hypothetical protein
MNHNQSKKSKQGKGTPKTNKNFIAWNPQNRKKLQSRAQRPKGSSSGQGRPNQLGGFGAMRSAPVVMSRQFKTNRPNMQTMRNGDCRIVHREYIADIIAAATGANFNNTQYPINPGQSSVFQWLSKIAQNFESYHFRKLKFDYETEAPSSLGGTLVLAVDYDASDSAPTTKQQMLAFRGSVRSAPWTPCQHSSVGEDLSKLKSSFVRPGLNPPNTDIKFYDVGVLNVATQGISTNSATCGELYVEYDVDLMTPLYEPVQNASSYQALTALTAAEPLGATGTLLGGLSIVVGNNGTNSTLTLSNATIGSEYSVSTISAGTVITAAVGVNSATGATTTTTATAFNASATVGSTIQTFKATATTIVFIFLGTATTITTCDVLVCAIPSSGF